MSKKLLYFLAILLIVSLETPATTMVRGDKVMVCNTPKLNCMFKCYTGSGHCMRCCQGLGFVHGRCSLFRDDLCYCCITTDDPPAAAGHRGGRQPLTGGLAPGAA